MLNLSRLMMLVLISSGMLYGCGSPAQREAAGTVGGAVAGGIIGAQIGSGSGQVAGAVGGAVLGAFLGNALMSDPNNDGGDKREAQRAFTTASRAPAGETIYWTNTRTGNWGYYRPIKDGHSQFEGYFCREFESKATIDGASQRVYGTACRLPNGTWRAM